MPTPAERHETALRRLFDGVWNGEEPAVADGLVHPAYVIHDRDVPGDLSGPDVYRWLAEGTRAIFPDASFAVEDVVASGDRVAVRWTMTGTHDGPGLGVEPTGERVTLPAVEIDRFEDGLLAETWTQSDMLGLLRAVRAIPGDEDGAPGGE